MACALSSFVFGQITLSSWDFENLILNPSEGTTPSLLSGSFVSNSGILKLESEFSGFHALSSTDWYTPAGNGSIQSITSNSWKPNDYYQFKFSTKNYSGISISFDVDGSNTGPRDFKVQYSTDGSIFTDLTSGSYVVSYVSFKSGSPNSSSKRNFDLSSITSLDDFESVFIRLVNTSAVSIAGGTVGTSGSSKLDNFTVKASTTLGLVKDQIEDFGLYPNPVEHGNFAITSKNGLNKQVTIYSLLGKQVYNQTVKANETVEVSFLNKGIYILKVEEEGKLAIKKLIIQ